MAGTVGRIPRAAIFALQVGQVWKKQKKIGWLAGEGIIRARRP